MNPFFFKIDEEDNCLACSNKQKEMDRVYNVTESPRGLARLRLARAEVIEQSITIIMESEGESEREREKERERERETETER